LERLREIAAMPRLTTNLDELAWLLATYRDSKSRDGTEQFAWPSALAM